MKILKNILLISLTIFMNSCSHKNQVGYYRGYEIPSYKVSKKIADIEIRNYQPQLVAEVEVIGEREKAANEGFWILAKYIFGDNIAKEKISMTSPVNQKELSQKIAMTSPVNQISQGEKKWLIQFKMPKKYNLSNLPQAKNSRIKFREIPAKKTISITFSGFWTDKKFCHNQKKLQQFIKENNLVSKNDKIFAYYDDPFTLPWNRRNEVIQEIE